MKKNWYFETKVRIYTFNKLPERNKKIKRKFMKAIVLKTQESPLAFEDIEKPKPKTGEALVKLRAAALNHRDLWIRKGLYPNVKFPCVMGSDGAGVVEETGKGVDDFWLKKPVLINPALNWGDDRSGHGKDFEILGVPSQGTFAEYVCVPAENLHEIPYGWNFEHAAALPLAGLTAHRALFYRGGLKAGQQLLITGVGGGVASFLLAFAIKTEAKVYVTSSSGEKIKKAMEMGAVDGVNYQKENWKDELKKKEPEGFDLIVDSAGGSQFPVLLELLRTGGRIVNFGGTAGKIPEIVPARIFWKQASILGTTMGSPADFESMMEFVSDLDLRPVIDKHFTLDSAEEAFRHLDNQSQFGKVIINIGNY